MLSNNQPQQPPNNNKQVRALYDFEAAEDNEISFSAGDIITVCDDRYVMLCLLEFWSKENTELE